jgi:hypothetical protein
MTSQKDSGSSRTMAKPAQNVAKSSLYDSTQTTTRQPLPPFDIRDHLDALTLDDGTQTALNPSYKCPACGAENFKIDMRTGAYQGFSCGCTETDAGTRKIRNTVAPLEPWEKQPRPASQRTWDYTNATGSPMLRVIRSDDGAGKRRIWQEPIGSSAKPAELIPSALPYRYEECLDAIVRGKLIFWVEGESVADRLWAIGIAATTTIGGSGGYRSDRDSGLFPPESIVICPDRDPPGLKYAAQVAADYPEAKWCYADPKSRLWHRLEDGGGYDLADWIDVAGATADQLVAAIEPRRMPTPVPSSVAEPENQADEGLSLAELGAEVRDLMPQPVGDRRALVPRFFDALEAQAEAFNAPIDAVIAPFAALCGGCLPSTVRGAIDRRTGYYSLPNLNVLTIGGSGNGKTPIQSALVGPIRAANKREYDRHVEAMARYRTALKIWERDKSGETEQPVEPTRTHYCTNNATTEALTRMLAGQPGKSALIIVDEMSGFLGSFDRYAKGGGGGDRAFFLSLYGQETIEVDRASGDSWVVSNPSAPIVGGIQPHLWNAYIQRDTAGSDGLPARFLLVDIPKTRRPGRRSGPTVDLAPALAAIYQRLESVNPDYVADLSPEAGASWDRFHESIETRRMAESAPLMESVYPKYQDAATRLALIMHCVDAVIAWKPLTESPAMECAPLGLIIDPPTEISGETMDAAIEFIETRIATARRFYAGADATSDDPLSAAIAEFAQKFAGQTLKWTQVRAQRPKIKTREGTWVKQSKSACLNFMNSVAELGYGEVLNDTIVVQKIRSTPSRDPSRDPNNDPNGSRLEPLSNMAASDFVTQMTQMTQTQVAGLVEPTSCSMQSSVQSSLKTGDPVEITADGQTWTNGHTVRGSNRKLVFSPLTRALEDAWSVTTPTGETVAISMDCVRPCAGTTADEIGEDW